MGGGLRHRGRDGPSATAQAVLEGLAGAGHAAAVLCVLRGVLGRMLLGMLGSVLLGMLDVLGVLRRMLGMLLGMGTGVELLGLMLLRLVLCLLVRVRSGPLSPRCRRRGGLRGRLLGWGLLLRSMGYRRLLLDLGMMGPRLLLLDLLLRRRRLLGSAVAEVHRRWLLLLARLSIVLVAIPGVVSEGALLRLLLQRRLQRRHGRRLLLP